MRIARCILDTHNWVQRVLRRTSFNSAPFSLTALRCAAHAQVHLHRITFGMEFAAVNVDCCSFAFHVALVP